jgi:Ni,Fe-hydrogenase maturation factor
LVNYVQEADDVLVFDVIGDGLQPGTLKVVRFGAIGAFGAALTDTPMTVPALACLTRVMSPDGRDMASVTLR